ncbi:MAG TPA: TrkH family potassium uptake protein [Clostridia bacterium]|nr:TrkH family potassium uptake protein [Clostridia bacterium]
MRPIVPYFLSRILQLEGILLLLPLLVSLIYREPFAYWGSFLGTAILVFAIGKLLSLFQPKDERIYAKEGLILASSSWLLMSIFGALPLWLSGDYPHFLDALFETISGFTTTGATVATAVEDLGHSILFWRSFTHLIGGMGVLVFALAVFPSGRGSIHMAKAEMPGPSFSKVVAKLSETARILYMIYLAMTVILTILLLIAGMPLFDSLCHAFATAGTGGFGIKNTSIAFYQSNSIESILAVFMILFGINFNLYFLLMMGQVKKFWKSEELRFYLGLIFGATVLIFIQTHRYSGKALLDSFFTVASIITTTGFSTANFDIWPLLSRGILLLLMFIGAMAGSTGGGLKVSRTVILGKSGFRELIQARNPKRVIPLRFENQAVSRDQLRSISSYMSMYTLIFIGAFFILLLDLPNFISAFSAVAATINNIGPGFDIVGPTGNFASLSYLSKTTLSFCMLAGRLELWPVLVLFSPSTWKKI